MVPEGASLIRDVEVISFRELLIAEIERKESVLQKGFVRNDRALSNPSDSVHLICVGLEQAVPVLRNGQR